MSISLLATAAAAVVAAAAPPPHIVFFMADDLGRANVGFLRDDAPASEVRTPAIDALAADGLVLERMYAYMFCSPTRSSFLSGRLPLHVNTRNDDPSVWNATSGEGAGIGTNMTGIAALLKRARYSTAAVGKWDAGMATAQHTPAGRGFDRSLIYFHHCNDYWTSTVSNATDGFCSGDSATVDLWRDGAPAKERAPGGAWEDVYEEEIFKAEASAIIGDFARGNDGSSSGNDDGGGGGPRRLFLYYASHLPHTPMQVEQRVLDGFLNESAALSLPGMGYAAMAAALDAAVANVTAALRQHGMWNDTLFVFQSDNGGPIYAGNFKATGDCPSATRPGMTGPGGREPYRSTCLDFGGAANNWPLRGGKESCWEGGVRVAAFVGGGALPAAQRGTRCAGLLHTADWLATFGAGLAGLDPTDARGAASGLPPIDSLDMWPMLSGANATSPRVEAALGGVPGPRALVTAQYKLLLGRAGAPGLGMDGWTGPHFPNASSMNVSWPHAQTDCSGGCLFDLLADPTEHTDLARSMPEKVAELTARLEAAEATAWAPGRGTAQRKACDVAAANGGFYGPFEAPR